MTGRVSLPKSAKSKLWLLTIGASMLRIAAMTSSSTLSATLATSGALTREETARLRELEETISEGFESFLKVGIAFAEVRLRKLHRATHDRFEDYCRDRWALSLSRCNQIINTVKVVEHITQAFPQDAPMLAETNESTLRPLSRLEPELQVVTWELIRHLEERPTGTTIQQVVSTIRSAIESGWQAKNDATRGTGSANGRNGTTPHRTHHRQSDQLGTLCRWVNRINTWDPEAIAAADDELRLKRHLKAARQLRTFCEAFIAALEDRLSN
jgi:hypothetical protein